jgi:hypothetical protein
LLREAPHEPREGDTCRGDLTTTTIWIVAQDQRTIITMEFQVDIWLRGTNHATTAAIAPVAREPRAWTDADVTDVLVGMLRALERANNPKAELDRPIALRGFSWIVNPFEGGGVVIALELSLGAVIAGPFDVAERELTERIARLMAAERTAAPPSARSETIH